MSYNPDLPDGVLGWGLAAVMGADGGSKLARLRWLSVSGCNLGEEGSARLLSVLERGACPRLERLHMDVGLEERVAGVMEKKPSGGRVSGL